MPQTPRHIPKQVCKRHTPKHLFKLVFMPETQPQIPKQAFTFKIMSVIQQKLPRSSRHQKLGGMKREKKKNTAVLFNFEPSVSDLCSALRKKKRLWSLKEYQFQDRNVYKGCLPTFSFTCVCAWVHNSRQKKKQATGALTSNRRSWGNNAICAA